MIVVDGSRPEDCLRDAEVFVNLVEQRVKECQMLSTSKGAGRERDGEDGDEALWGSHPDSHECKAVLPFPVVVVVAKYDVFLGKFSEYAQRNAFAKALRLFCHQRRFSLVFTANSNDSSLKAYKALCSRYVFQTQGRPTAVSDHNKFIVLPSGADTLEDIADRDLGKLSRSLVELFGKPSPLDTAQGGSAQGDAEEARARETFPEESEVDALRALKDIELKRYREEQKSKMRAQQQQQQQQQQQGQQSQAPPPVKKPTRA